MTRTRQAGATAKAGLGNALKRDKQKQLERMKREAQQLNGITEFGPRGPSVLEQTSLDSLIATVELRKELYADDMGEAEYVAGGAVLLGPGETAAAEQAAFSRRDLVSIPRRPQWHDGMSAEELASLEAEAFMDWRRTIERTAQDENLHMTPYERNLDFWRQLWRCCEWSDLLVQIVDARDVDFYFCKDLVRFVEELGGERRMVLLANKADYLTEAQRQQWADYFKSRGVDAIFFSALRELKRQEKEELGLSTLQERVAAAEVDAAEAPDAPAAVDISASASQMHRQQDVSVFIEMAGMKEDAPDVVPTDGADVPVPGLSDTDDDLKEDQDERRRSRTPDEQEGGDRAEQGEQEDAEEAKAAEEDEPEAAVMGQLAEDDLAVADAARLIEELCSRLPEAGQGAPGRRITDETSSDAGAGARRRGTIGFIGYPNVGKSTVINALLGSRKVAMSKRPGKTKHIQTMELTEIGVTLCDCPGLVFPSYAATKAHLVINNTVPLDDLREVFSSITLIIQKIGFANILKRYDCEQHVLDARKRSGDHVLTDTHAFLAAFAVARHHLLRKGVPDEQWAARKVLKDYVSGALLHVEAPPGVARAAADAAQGSGLDSQAAGEDAASDKESGGEESGDAEDFFDHLGSYLKEQQPKPGKQRHMTKRRMRVEGKKLLRGGVNIEADLVGVNFREPHKG